eukprot:s677_g13.t3
MSNAFKQTQDKWCETWLTDEDLCDAVAVVGPERQRVLFIRAHLATISQPLKAALYGEFREGQTRELILPNVSVDAFDVMIRSAYHLEPKLTPHRALHALAAAKLYMIYGLEKYCHHYLQHVDWDCITCLKLLSESLKSSLALPVELQRTFCKEILAQCERIVESPVFLETHGIIIASLIKLDEFDVKEDRLWERLMEWSVAAVRKPELLGPFDVTSCSPLKRAKSTSSECSMNPREVMCQEEVFRLMLPHIRCTQMSQKFFIDNARKYLDREKSEAVMDFFVLRRNPEGLVFKPRAALLCLQASGVSKLVDSMVSPNRVKNHTVDLGGPAQVTSVQVVFTDILWKEVRWSVSLAGTRSEEVVMEKTNEFGILRGTLRSQVPIRFDNMCSELVLEFSFSIKLKTIIVEGRRMSPELEHAHQVVDQLFEEHWKELSSFVADLFQGACGEDATSTDAGCMPRQSLGAADSQRPKAQKFGEKKATIQCLSKPGAMRWEEVQGDIQPTQPETEGGQGAPPQNEMEAPSTGDPVRAGYQAASSSSSPYEPKAAARSQRRAPSWQQVEEMISHLIDPMSGKVRVYRDVLSFLPDEEVLAVYPEKIIMPIVAKVKIIITCGLEYYLHWRRQRRDGAIILTDKRLIHVVTHFSRYRKSLKVDMYTVGKSVRYVGLRPPRWQCCARPAGDLSVATRLGTMEVRLLQMKRLRDCAQRMWQGFAALQDTQSVSSVEYDDWASVAEDFEESDAAEERSASEDLEILEEAKEEAGALWGDNSGDAAADADLEEGIPAEAAAEQVPNEDEGIVRFSATRAELWGLVMAPGEKPLWGPCLFEEEVFRACCPQRRGARNRRRPASLVTFTDRRLIVIQYRSVGPLCCGGICHRAPVDNVSIIPLKNVLGFSVEERFSMQRAMIVKLMAKACCRPMSESFLCVKVLSNAALGKVYLDSLSVRQRVLPLFADPPCNFEEDKVLELRRWLGNVALFFSGASEKVSQRPVLELWRCERGLAPE